MLTLAEARQAIAAALAKAQKYENGNQITMINRQSGRS
jgi:uncharacterized protein GlcG (DUF336 family)